MDSSTEGAITNITWLVGEQILKKLAGGAIKYLARDSIENMVYEIVQKELSAHKASPAINININLTIENLYLVLEKDNRFNVKDKSIITLAKTNDRPLLPESTVMKPIRTATAIRYGQEGTGTIENNSKHYWEFVGQRGDIINIRITPEGYHSLHPQMHLLDPSGDVVAEGDGWGCPKPILGYKVKIYGTYSICIYGFNGTNGMYRLSLEKEYFGWA